MARKKRPATRVERARAWVLAHRWWSAGIVVLIVAAIVIPLVAVLQSGPAPARALPPTRARTYLAFDACLLTGAQGLADPSVRPVWAGMQDASLATHAKVSYLAVAGPQTVGNAIPYANTLLQRQCNVIVGIGQSQVDAINQAAPANKTAKFIVVGGSSGAPNVTTVAADRPAVAQLITGLVH
ncbi:MAG TPA: hypothetical protein VJ914_23490 [Pseudonocardiaceae bacterium]|nr:hypothetical protein [Pseudonocardiaceae bacterium]